MVQRYNSNNRGCSEQAAGVKHSPAKGPLNRRLVGFAGLVV
jgi:hypothetical protein